MEPDSGGFGGEDEVMQRAIEESIKQHQEEQALREALEKGVNDNEQGR